jgi:enoyl-CoA hydratase
LPDSEFLRFESRQAIRIITLDRPSALHALNFSMVSDLASAMRTFSNSDNAKAIVLRGSPIESGKKSFCAGGDVVRTF